MAAAALRRLGGSASLAAAQALHLPPAPSAAVSSRIQAKHLCSEVTRGENPTSTRSPLAQIAETKEELYRLMADNAGKIGRQNLGLLKQLAAHVEPKPDDPTWRFYRRAKMVNTALFYSFFSSAGLIAAYHSPKPHAAKKQDLV